MGYETRLEGALWIEPAPQDQTDLREALTALAEPRVGRLVLTPMGRGLLFEHSFDWEGALALLGRVRAEVLLPRGIALGGVLRALGEDGAHLATVTFDAEGIHLVRHELDEEG